MEIENKRLHQDMKQHYGYCPNFINEVTGGSVGYTYSVDNQFFLKLYDTRLVMTQRCTETLGEQLALLDILQNKSLLKDKICYPIKTITNDYYYKQDHFIGVLFNFIEGSTLGYANQYSENDILQLSAIVKQLHSLDTNLFCELCPKETYHLTFGNSLLQLLDEQLINLPSRFYQIASEYKNVLEDKVKEAKSIAGELKKIKLPNVLCHTDIHGGNLIRNGAGELILVDWENVILAPKEADLFTFCEESYFPLFSGNANENALLYYVIRRDLEDIYEFLNRVLHHEYLPDEENEVYGHVVRILNHLKDTK